MKILERIQVELERRKAESTFRELGKPNRLIDFSSNDYLGLSQNERLIDRVKWRFEKATTKTLGSGGSRLLAGNYTEFEELETVLAEVHGKESALVFNSGYVANLAVFSSIPKKDDLILYDDLIHACIKEGARLSFAKHQSFRHNDLKDLKRKILLATGNVFVAVESVYSMDGDFAPLMALVGLCEETGANLIVDEAHSTGIFGKKGAGLVSQLGLDKRVFIKIHTFGKGLGAHGAAIACDSMIKEYLINFSRSFIYTTSIPPHSVITLLEAYKFIEEFDFLQKDLMAKIFLFTQTVLYSSSPNNCPIQSIVIPGNDKVKRIAKKLQDLGYDVKPVLSPTVKIGTERLRICIHNHNSDEDIIGLAKAINELF
jgi:8-amino-7-oxononanoate synthase